MKEQDFERASAAERRRRHQFGQPEGNKPGCQSTAVAQREFYKWVESEATEEELAAYLADPNKPAMRKRFIEAYRKAEEVNDFLQVTNQVHGAPKQTVEVKELPKINCKVFGKD